MDNFYFTKDLSENSQLCISQLTNRKLSQAEHGIDDASGYFLYEQTGDGDAASVRILARLASDEAVLTLSHMFGLR